MPLTATLSPPELTAEPGASAAFTLEVTNDAAASQDVRFEVLGPAGAWAVVVPPSVSVPAAATARARVMVRVPRSPHVPPGPTLVRVRATGADVQGVVHVAPFADVRASLSPRATRSRRDARYTLHVENLGNEPALTTPEPGTADRRLVVDLDRGTVTVGPGEVAAVPVGLRARRPRLVGRPKALPFDVAVRTGSGIVVTTEGLLVQERARWPVPAAVALVVLLGLAAVVAARAREGRDEPARPSLAAPTATGSTPGQTATCPPDAAGEPGELVVQNFLFCPATVTVPRGSELRWTNRDAAPHTVSADSDSFDTGNFVRGEVRSIRFDTPGTLGYFCRLHPFMRGTVVVT